MDELDAIRARAEAATPGPWDWQLTDSMDPYALQGPGRADVLFPSALRPLAVKRADRIFIAAARTDIPTLLAALDAVTAERDRYRAALEPLVAIIPIERLCVYCGEYILHDGHAPACPIMQGRALLTPDPAEAGGAVR